MNKHVLTAVSVLLSVVCGVYGILVCGAASGTVFFLVWFVIAVGFLALGLSFFFSVWEKVPRIVIRAILCIVIAGGLVFGAVEFQIVRQLHASGMPGLDYIIVLGAQVRENGPSTVLKYRLDRAVVYLKENPDTVCIVSGGQGHNEPFPEAEGMAEYLWEQGIQDDRLLMESESGTTEENIKNSLRLIEKGASVGIVTNDFHVFRAMQTAERAGLENACAIAAGSSPLYLPNNMLREFFAEIKFLML